MNLSKLIISITFLICLASCGGGSGSSTSPNSGGGSSQGGSGTSADFSGVVIDGYIQGATVCLDFNSNLKCDTDEPSSVSREGGAYSITYSGNVPAGTQILAVVTTDATDEDTGPVQSAYNLLAPSNAAQVITPFTTLVSDEILSSGKTLSSTEAEAAVKNSLGIDETTSLIAYDFIENEDEDLKNAATAIVTALASSTESMNEAASDSLTDTERAYAAIKVSKALLGSIVSNGDTLLDADAIKTQVETVVTGSINNIIAGAKSGTGSVVNLEEALTSGELVIVYSGEEYIDQKWVEGLVIEPLSFDGNVIANAGGQIELWEIIKLGILPYDTLPQAWVPFTETENDYVISDQGWVREIDLESSGLILDENCATFYNNSEAVEELCFIQKDVSGKTIKDVIPDICLDGGSVIPGCDREAKLPSGSHVYDYTKSVPENELGGFYEMYGTTGDWTGYVDQDLVQSLENFISSHTDNKISWIGEGCNTAFRVASYSTATKQGFMEYADAGDNGCRGNPTLGEWESRPFEVIEFGTTKVLKALSSNVYKANNPGEEPYHIFSKVPNDNGVEGIFSGSFTPQNTRISLPFNGSLEYGVFASRTFVDFVLEISQLPEFPYEAVLSQGNK